MERETAYIIDEMHKLGISLTEQQSEQLYDCLLYTSRCV